MDLDQRARAASDDLVRTSAWAVDVESRLAELPVLRRRRTRARVVLTAAATAVVMVIGGAAWLATASPGPDHSQPVAPDELSPTPVTIDDPTALRKGFVGLPPEGAVPSSPIPGELVLGVMIDRVRTWVYADGRMISYRNGAGTIPEAANPTWSGFLERRLTPEGVDLLRSWVLDNATGYGPATRSDGLPPDHSYSYPHFVRTQDDQLVPAAVRDCGWYTGCNRITGTETWLPASAWIDQRYRAYVPTQFRICFGSEPTVTADRIRAAMPPDAARLLSPSTPGVPGSNPTECAVVGIEDARIIDNALQATGFERPADTAPYMIRYVLDVPPDAGQADPVEASVIFQPVLPHGEAACTSCG